MNRKRAVMAAFFMMMLLLAGVLSGCGFSEKKELTDEEGNALVLTLDELTEEGFYVLDRKEHTFRHVMSAAEGREELSLSTGKEKTDYKSRFLWFGFKDTDLEALIPRVDNKRYFLVVYQKEEGSMPESYTLEMYKKRGYTLGVSFTFGESGNIMHIDTNSMCESSMAKEVLSGCSNGLLRVHKINGSRKLPNDNVDVDMNKLLGLQKNKKYQLGFFDGTQYRDTTLLADTVVYQSQGSVKLSNPLKVTEHNFFYVRLPKNIKPGIFYINSEGLFQYAGGN